MHVDIYIRTYSAEKLRNLRSEYFGNAQASETDVLGCRCRGICRAAATCPASWGLDLGQRVLRIHVFQPHIPYIYINTYVI